MRVVPFLFATNLATKQVNWKRLGLDNAEAQEAHDYMIKWYTGDPNNPGAIELHWYSLSKSKLTRFKVLDIINKFYTTVHILCKPCL